MYSPSIIGANADRRIFRGEEIAAWDLRPLLLCKTKVEGVGIVRRIAFIGLLGVCHGTFAQPPTRLEFEVATVKLNTECVHGVGREQHSQGRFGVECVSLREYIRGAYGAPNARSPVVLGGPKWVDTDHFDIIATAPGDTRLVTDTGFGGAYSPRNLGTHWTGHRRQNWSQWTV
jgi:hypothetical protein